MASFVQVPGHAHLPAAFVGGEGAPEVLLQARAPAHGKAHLSPALAQNGDKSVPRLVRRASGIISYPEGQGAKLTDLGSMGWCAIGSGGDCGSVKGTSLVQRDR